MGVTVEVQLVDWDAVQNQWRDEPTALESDDFYDNATDDGWPVRFRADYLWSDGWVGSWHDLAEADECYDDLRLELDDPHRHCWDHLTAVFFHRNREPTSYDLPGFHPGERIANILGSDSVDRLANEVSAADLERLRQPFDLRCNPDHYRRITNFDEFADYMRQWFAAVDAAHRSGKALVLWVA